MRWLDSIGKIFILAAAAVIILWLLLDKCNPTSGISDKVRKDAIARALDSAGKKWQLREDSLKFQAHGIEERVDSLREAKTISDQKVKIYSDRAAALSTEIIRARTNRDTTILMEKCDSLAHVVQRLNFSLVHHKWIIDSLIITQDNLVSANEKRAEESAKFIRAMDDSITAISAMFDDLDSRHTKALKKLGRKYTVSLSAGYGIAPSTSFQPFVGITFGRTLIRF